jgi:hypothetical protein
LTILTKSNEMSNYGLVTRQAEGGCHASFPACSRRLARGSGESTEGASRIAEEIRASVLSLRSQQHGVPIFA